jgi:subtilisin-like proprotein convertase family protein
LAFYQKISGILPSKVVAIYSLLLGFVLSYLPLQAQPGCSPDNTPPTILGCPPSLLPIITLDGAGNAALNPSNFVSGVTDNCPGTPTLQITPSNLTCGNVPGAFLTITATDAAMNVSAPCIFFVFVVDNSPPVITCPADVTVDCNTFNQFDPLTSGGFATAYDNCGTFPPLHVDSPISGPSSCVGITRTWYTQDVFGNYVECDQIITVEDNTDPIFDWNLGGAGYGTPPANMSVSCDALPIPAPLVENVNFSVEEDCSTPVVTTPEVSTQGGDPTKCAYYEYTITRTYTAEDACGNTTEVPQVFTIFDDDAPVFSGPLTVTKPANANCQYTFAPGGELAVSAFDACAGAWPVTPPGISNLTTSFAVVRNLDGVTVNSGPGLDAAGTYNAGIYTITYSASDPCGNLDFHQVTLTVSDLAGPVVACVSSIIVSIPPTGTFTITPAMIDAGSYDQCSPVTMTVSPSVMTCANLGLPLLDPVVLTVTDANGNSNSCSIPAASVTVTDNSPPQILCKDVTVTLDAAGNVTVPAFDANPSVTQIDNGSFDACDPTLHYRIANDFDGDGTADDTYTTTKAFNCSDIGANPVILRVGNTYPPFNIPGNFAYCNATVTVVDNTAPSAVCNPAVVNLGPDGMAKAHDSRAFSSTDVPKNIPDNNPSGVNSTRVVSGSGTILDANVTFSITHTQVGDLKVTLTSPGGTTVTLIDRPGVPATTAGCSGDNLNVTLDDHAANTAAMLESACNGTPPAISGTYRPANPLAWFNGENINGTWTLKVIDSRGTNTGSLMSWSLDLKYDDGTSSVPGLLATLGAGTTDNCGASWFVTPNMYDCSQTAPPAISYTLTATDESGNFNTITCNSAITVQDVMPPMISCGNLTVNLNANGNYTLLPKEVLTGGIYVSSGDNDSGASGSTQYCVTASKPMTILFDWTYQSYSGSAGCDPFGYSVNGVFTQLSTGATCGSGTVSQSGTNTTVSLTQGQKFCFVMNTTNNLADRAEAWIKNIRKQTLAGQVVPSEINDPALWMQMGSTNTDGKAFFYDACSPVSMSITPNSFTCANVASPVTYTVTVTDDNANSSTCTGTVTIRDNQPPQAQCDEVVVNLDGDGEATIPAEDFDQGSTDACCLLNLDFQVSLDGGITFLDDLDITCANIGANQMVVLKVSDCATPPNDAFCMTTLTVNDKLPPAFIMCPDDVTLECDDFPLTDQFPAPAISGIAMAEDNCDGMITPVLITPEVTMPAGITSCPPNQRAAYIISNVGDQPWLSNGGGLANTSAMDAVFGTSNWDQLYFETVNPLTLFTSAYDVIFLEGSDLGADELNTFLQTNRFDIEDWVAAGGSLFLNAAPKEGGDIHFGFGGVVLKGSPYYNNASPKGNVAVPTHPIFTGATLSPAFTPAAGNFTGTDFSHAVICPPGMAGTDLILTNLPGTPAALVEMDWGFGKVMFGGMTTPNFHMPVLNADNMRRNILSYLNSKSNCGTLTSTFFNRDCRLIKRRWSATDSRGNTSLCFQDITVEDNTYPTLSFTGGFPSNVTVECDAIPNPPTVTMNDNCTANKPATLRDRFNSTQGNDPDSCTYYNYTFQRFWTGVDNCGNTVTSAAQTITVQDTEAPEFANAAPTSLVVPNDPGLCEAYIAPNGLLNMESYISDNCAAFANLTLSYCVYAGSPAGALLLCGPGADLNATFDVGLYTIIYTATDPCNNSEMHEVVFQVKDTETPNAQCYPLSKTLNNNGTASIDPSDIDLGNSDDNCGIMTLTLNQSAFDCSDLGPNTIILTATDAAGNIGKCTTTVTITLAVQPGILCQNNLTVNCTENLDPFNPLSPTDPAQVITAGPCNGLITPTYLDASVGEPNCRTIQRTWTAGTATCVQTITVVDPQAPVFVAASLPATSSCLNPIPVAPNRTANDNCLGVMTILPEVTSHKGSDPTQCSFYDYNIDWKWTANDKCNAATVATHTVHITDLNAPDLAIANPFIYPTDPDECEATVILNLLDYITDCAEDQYLTVTNTITNQATMLPVANGNGTTNINGVYQPGLYTVSVTMTDPCGKTATESFTLHVKDTQSPEAHCFDSGVTLDNSGNGTLTVTQVDNGSHDNCGSITLSFVAPPAAPVTTLFFDTGDIGTQVVTLFVTDATGNTNTCTATITVSDDPTFIAGSAIGAPGEMKLLPITVMQYQDIVSFQMKLAVGSTSIASIVDIIPVHPSLAGGFVYTTPVPATNVVVGWSQPLPLTGVDITDGDILFNVKVMISNSATPGNSTTLDIDQATLDVGQLISGVPTQVNGLGIDGSIHVVTPGASRTVSGELRTMPDPHPAWPVPGPDPCASNYNVLIPISTIGYSGTISGTQPSPTGAYSLVVPNAANLTVTPTKGNPAFFGNPVTAYDAFRVQNYAVGNDPPDANPALAPLQIVAADANNDNVVTQFDATLIQELSAHATSLPKYWRFIPEPVALALPAYPFVPGFNEFLSYTNITADIANADFIGVRVGNVFGCEDPNLFTSNGNSGDRGSKALFAIEERAIVAGEEVSITLKAKDFTELVSCQYTLNFNQQTLQFVEAMPNALAANASGLIFNAQRAEEGLLAFSWFNHRAVTLTEGEAVFTLTFKALKDAATLAELLAISSDYIIVEAAKKDGTFVGAELVFEGGATAAGESLKGTFALYQNTPNPFAFRTEIGFSLPESTEVTLTISDAAGKVVKVIQGHYSAGYHKVFVERKELEANGVLFYRLDTPTHTAVRKMILID